MGKKLIVSAALNMLLLVTAPAGSASEYKNEIPTWTKAGMLSGALVSKEECDRPDRVWVQDQTDGFCIRYFANRLEPRTETAIVFFHGDLVGSDWDRYGHPVRATFRPGLQGEALFRNVQARTRERTRLPLVLISRPGALGSSGDHKQKFKPQESRVASLALDAIKARHGIKRLVLAGQSGGASLVANILPKRDDVRCAVMGSGAVALHRYALDVGFARLVYSEWEDPIASLEAIRTKTTPMFILAGDGDKIRPVRYQQTYAKAAAYNGHPAHFFVLKKKGDPHILDREVISVADACGNGSGIQEIRNLLPAVETSG